jgi:hypothetical protein
VSGANVANIAGDTRQFIIYPDFAANGNSTILHHAQVEEMYNASSPIATSGTKKTRAADDYSITVGDWYNDNEGTFHAEATPRFYKDNNNNAQTLLGEGNNRYFFFYNGDVRFRVGGSSSIITKYTNYERTKVAISLTENEIRASASGSSVTRTISGNDLLSAPSSISLGAEGFLGTLHGLRYYPTALPESTLNTLTS